MDESERDTAGPADSAGAAGPANQKATDEAKYIADLLARGEAVVVDPTQKSEEQAPLPPGVTHEIIPGKDGEPPTIRRRRYSAF